MTGRNRILVGAGVSVVILIAVVVLVVNAGSGSKGSSSASATTSPTGDTHPSSHAGSTSSTSAAPTTSTTATSGQGAATTTTQPIPLEVAVSGTTNLHDGQVVTVTVTADPGSAFYGLDARLCAGSPAIATFYDYTPDPAGNCILHPLSAHSDAYLQVPVASPYKTGTLTFRVGVGTDHFTTENLDKVAITCGPGHPCQLVVRLQYPHGSASDPSRSPSPVDAPTLGAVPDCSPSVATPFPFGTDRAHPT